MHLKSMYPPLPAAPETNVYNLLCPPEVINSDTDYVLHVDALTGEERSRKQFIQRVFDGATALASPESVGGLGINGENGEVVGIYSHNCLDYITLVHSLIVNATPIVFLSAFATPYELVHLMRTTQCTRIFISSSHLLGALVAAQEVGFPQDRFYILEGHAEGRETFGEMIDHVRRNKITTVSIKPANKDTLLFIVMSSGTSGLPKAVMISHGNEIAAVLQGAVLREADAMPPPTGPVITLAFLPFYHSAGLHLICLGGISVPQTFVILPKWDLETAIDIIPKYRISMVPIIPSIVHQLANYRGKKRLDLSTIKRVMGGAAHTPSSLVSKFATLMPKDALFTEGYGQSEMTQLILRPPLSTTLGGRVEHHPESMGILLPGIEARIMREDGSEADYNEPGELWVRCEGVSMGYMNNAQATKQTFLLDGWVKTGDTMKADEQGRFFYVDRVKDTLKVSGMQVSPTEIEDALLAHPEKLIIDVCVAGVQGSRTSDERVPRAWIVLSDEGRKQGADIVIAKLEAWIDEKLSTYKKLRGGVEVVNEIPKNPTGKMLRGVLVERYEQNTKTNVKL